MSLAQSAQGEGGGSGGMQSWISAKVGINIEQASKCSLRSVFTFLIVKNPHTKIIRAQICALGGVLVSVQDGLWESGMVMGEIRVGFG